MTKVIPAGINEPVPTQFSIYLDGLRICAAYYVFLFHLKKQQIGPDFLLKFIPDRGHDAVILFFVLSGYVIAATVDRKKALGLREYFLDRAARVYSVALPTLLFSITVALVIHWFAPENAGSINLWSIFYSSLVNLFFLGQSWQLKEWVVYNQPYWSLCYEVMYYLIFGVGVFLKSGWRYIGLAVAACIAGPKVLLLFPCWLLGIAAYYWRDKWRITIKGAVFLGVILPVLILFVLNKMQFGSSVRNYLDFIVSDKKEILEFSEDFLIDYVTATMVAVNLYAARYFAFALPSAINKIFREGAAISFTLYLMHLPMIFLVLAFAAESRHTLSWFVTCAVGVPACCYFISKYTENKRASLRQWMGAHIPVLRAQS